MTREEAVETILDMYFTKEGTYFGEDYDKLIQSIYDDFESRTCENCKFYEEVYNEKGRKTHTIMQCSIIKEPFSATFGCNKFELKK